jgi:hypothetical protein
MILECPNYNNGILFYKTLHQLKHQINSKNKIFHGIMIAIITELKME